MKLHSKQSHDIFSLSEACVDKDSASESIAGYDCHGKNGIAIGVICCGKDFRLIANPHLC
jgi:hypothetical protein